MEPDLGIFEEMVRKKGKCLKIKGETPLEEGIEKSNGKRGNRKWVLISSYLVGDGRKMEERKTGNFGWFTRLSGKEALSSPWAWATAAFCRWIMPSSQRQ